MGLEVAAAVMAGVSVASEVGKSVAEANAAQSKQSALDLQGKEMRLASAEKTLGNYDVMQKLIAAQIAHQTTTGTTLDSPSFNAIQRDSYNIFTRKQNNEDIESEIGQANIKLEKENVKNTLYAQLFGNASDAAMTAFKAAGSVPTGG